MFRVYLKPGVSPEEVRGRIVERVGKQRHMFVMLNREIRDYVAKVMNQWFGLTYLQVIVAMLVAILGIVNTLTVSISDRRRELGVLRAVGGLRNQIRGTVWMEAVAIGIIGLVLGHRHRGDQSLLRTAGDPARHLGNAARLPVSRGASSRCWCR